MSETGRLDLVLRAAHFAARKHTDQRRKNGDIPYINHPISVARVLRVEGGIQDASTVAAALLHDTLEDTETTPAELADAFGDHVLGIVQEVSDDTTTNKVQRKQAQVEHGPHLSTEARNVKLADKTDNLRDLLRKPPPTWAPERVRGYFCWASTVVDGLRRDGGALVDLVDVLFATPMTVEGHVVRAVPEDVGERADVLAAYYASLGNR